MSAPAQAAVSAAVRDHACTGMTKAVRRVMIGGTQDLRQTPTNPYQPELI
jgi:hypothetical protein